MTTAAFQEDAFQPDFQVKGMICGGGFQVGPFQLNFEQGICPATGGLPDVVNLGLAFWRMGVL